jgi:competence protein ComEA
MTATPSKLDLNRATLDDLDRLPGIGRGLANRILEARDRHGRFQSLGDLRRVDGIGAVRLSRLREAVTVVE